MLPDSPQPSENPTNATTAPPTSSVSQVEPSALFWFGLEDAELAEAYPWEDWILAASRCGPIPNHDGETCLLEGVPSWTPNDSIMSGIA